MVFGSVAEFYPASQHTLSLKFYEAGIHISPHPSELFTWHFFFFISWTLPKVPVSFTITTYFGSYSLSPYTDIALWMSFLVDCMRFLLFLSTSSSSIHTAKGSFSGLNYSSQHCSLGESWWFDMTVTNVYLPIFSLPCSPQLCLHCLSCWLSRLLASPYS